MRRTINDLSSLAQSEDEDKEIEIHCKNLSYQNVNQCVVRISEKDKAENKIPPTTLVICGNYSAVQKDVIGKDWIFLQNIRFPKENMVRDALGTQVTTGYKWHVSLDDSTKDGNLEKGWNIVQEILIKYGVFTFKVIADDSRHKIGTKLQNIGKEITVYSFKEKRDDWEVIFQEITAALSAARVRPGSLAIEDTQVNGSNYISYRNDSKKKNTPDPFKDIKVNVTDQPKRVLSPLLARNDSDFSDSDIEDSKVEPVKFRLSPLVPSPTDSQSSSSELDSPSANTDSDASSPTSETSSSIGTWTSFLKLLSCRADSALDAPASTANQKKKSPSKKSQT